ncbi:hypothetical protein AB1Y20_005020 [Prymnesium parvum]|uniref:EF-hand domain-containing protein n=1 Tax=Prymnesium parvum TaxID=97485 RepID=A0AB34J630_PRYPA
MDSNAVVELLFALFDRDHSGLAQEADIVAALSCVTMSEERARTMLIRVEESGRPDRAQFQQLLEACVDLTLPKGKGEAPPAAWQARLIKLAIAVARGFERRMMKAEQFREASNARDCTARIRAMEEARRYDELSARQEHERRGVREAQDLEAVQFSAALKASLAEYEESVKSVVDQLRERHEQAYNELVQAEQAAMQQRPPRHGKDTLEMMRIQERLISAADFDGAAKYTKQIKQLVQRDEAATQAAAEQEMTRKLDALRAQQHLEMEGLRLRIQRNRAEHRLHWQQSASRMALAQRNMSTELDERQKREAHRAPALIKAQLEPLQRQGSRRLGNSSLGVKGGQRAGAAAGGGGTAAAATMSRPSKMPNAPHLSKSSHADWPNRPYTAQGFPAISPRASPRTSPRSEAKRRPTTK